MATWPHWGYLAWYELYPSLEKTHKVRANGFG